MTEYRPGAVVVRGREVMTLNYAGQWLAPGVGVPMPKPDWSWDVLRDGFEDEDNQLTPGLRERLVQAWLRDAHGVHFNKAKDDLTPTGRVAKWLRTVVL